MPRPTRTLALGSALATSLAAQQLEAAIITVDSPLDGPPGSPSDVCTLRSAIASFNTGNDYGSCNREPGDNGNEIRFASDLAYSTVTLTEDRLVANTAIKIVGPVDQSTDGIVIDGAEQSQILHANADLALHNLTLTRGYSPNQAGGCLQARDADLHLSHVRVSECRSQYVPPFYAGDTFGGGGVAVFGGDLVVIQHSEISGNSSDETGGGLILYSHRLEILDSVISHNEGYSFGGASFLGAQVEIHRSRIEHNIAHGSGGGLGLRQATPAPESGTLIMDSSISHNISESAVDGVRGGGLNLYLDTTIVNSTIANNQANAIQSSKSNWGGGIWAFGIELSLINSTVSGNQLGGPGIGAAIAFQPTPSKGRVELLHVTLDGNSGPADSANIEWFDFNDLELVIHNSIVLVPEGSGAACFQAADLISQSLISDTSCGGGNASDPTEVALQPLASNGGPTLTHALSPLSIAIDGAGDCLADFEISADQRGLARPGAGSPACDIGAYERWIDELFSDRFSQ